MKNEKTTLAAIAHKFWNILKEGVLMHPITRFGGMLMRTTVISMLVGGLLFTLTAPLNAQSGSSSALPVNRLPILTHHNTGIQSLTRRIGAETGAYVHADLQLNTQNRDWALLSRCGSRARLLCVSILDGLLCGFYFKSVVIVLTSQGLLDLLEFCRFKVPCIYFI